MNKSLEWSIKNTLGFSDGDLSANRDGKLSDKQRNMLAAKKNFCLQIATFGIGFVTIAFLANVFINPANASDKFAAALIMCVILATGLFYIWLKWSQYASDLRRGVAFAAEGQLELVPHYNRNRRIYSREIRIANAHFIVERKLFDLLLQIERKNLSCAIYYTPKSHVLLSFEVLNRK